MSLFGLISTAPGRPALLTPHQAKYIAHDLTAQHGGGALPGAWPQVLENAPTVEIRQVARLFIASFDCPSATLKTGPKTSLETGLENTKETPEKHQGTAVANLARAARPDGQSLGAGHALERCQCSAPPARAASSEKAPPRRPHQGRALGSVGARRTREDMKNKTTVVTKLDATSNH